MSRTKGQPHPIDIHVGEQMHKLRLVRGMSQQELGKTLGITFQQVQKYERGRNRVSASKLKQMADVFGVTPNHFFDGLPGPGADIVSKMAGALSRLDIKAATLFNELKNEKAKSIVVQLLEILKENQASG